MAVDVKAALVRKVGPLPVWGWGAVVIGGLVVYKVVTGGSFGGGSSPALQPISGGTLPDAFDPDADIEHGDPADLPALPSAWEVREDAFAKREAAWAAIGREPPDAPAGAVKNPWEVRDAAWQARLDAWAKIGKTPPGTPVVIPQGSPPFVSPTPTPPKPPVGSRVIPLRRAPTSGDTSPIPSPRRLPITVTIVRQRITALSHAVPPTTRGNDTSVRQAVTPTPKRVIRQPVTSHPRKLG